MRTIKYFLCILLSLISYSHISYGSRPGKAFPLWGTHVSIDASPSSEVDNWITIFKKLATEWEGILDPDCYYLKKNCKPGSVKVPKGLEDSITSYSTETLGYFNIHSDPQNEKSPRDFAGISEGFMLEQFRNAISTSSPDVIVDFGRDFLVLNNRRTVYWGDPILQIIPFAAFSIHNGYILGSSARTTGSVMRNPKVKQPQEWKEDFATITLIAKPSFSGSRLKAWATALMPGGKQLLDHLISLKPYQGQWTYAYLNNRTQELICAPDLKCQKGGERALYEISTPF